MSKLSGKYLFSELRNAELKGSEPLIESVLYERDNTILLGREKAGKSIMALQMACALSSGSKFLGEYEVKKPVDVVYIQAEGKLANTQANFINMNKVIDADDNRMMLLYYPSIHLDAKEDFAEINANIDSWRKPDVIFIDPLYMAMSGDMKDDVDSRRMIEAVRNMAEKYQATIVLVHHAHKGIRAKDGQIVEEGDDSIFGSFVWKAFPENILLLERSKGHKDYRKFSCQTQRMGNVFESLDLVLMEPTPLYFQIKGEGKPIDELVLQNVSHEGTNVGDLRMMIDRSYRHTIESLHRLVKDNRIERVNPNQNPSIYRRIK